MKLIVGLGNPGKEYSLTRHNIGFEVLDEYLKKNGSGESFSFDKKFNADIAVIFNGSEKTFLAKPQTYMNKSGDAVQKIVSYLGVDIEEDLLVVYDEMDIPFGKLRMSGTSAGGHKGMHSIIEHLGTDDLQRIRVGIRNEHADTQDTAHFVLQKFNTEEQEKLSKIIHSAHKELDHFVNH